MCLHSEAPWSYVKTTESDCSQTRLNTFCIANPDYTTFSSQCNGSCVFFQFTVACMFASLSSQAEWRGCWSQAIQGSWFIVFYFWAGSPLAHNAQNKNHWCTHSYLINKHRLTCRCADMLFLFLCSKHHIHPCVCFAFLTSFLGGLTSFVLHNNGDEIIWLPVATQYERFNRP